MSRVFPPVYAAGVAASREPGRRTLSVPREPERNHDVRRAARPKHPGRLAVVAEPHPRSRAAIEYALVCEGYELVDREGALEAPVLLFAGAGDGLHVLEVCDVAGALRDILWVSGPSRGEGSVALGIHAFVPRPFGLADVLRVARAVEGFDCRRKVPGTQARGASHSVEE